MAQNARQETLVVHVGGGGRKIAAGLRPVKDIAKSYRVRPSRSEKRVSWPVLATSTPTRVAGRGALDE